MTFWILTSPAAYTDSAKGWIFLTKKRAQEAVNIAKKKLKDPSVLNTIKIEPYKVNDKIILNSLMKSNPELFL